MHANTPLEASQALISRLYGSGSMDYAVTLVTNGVWTIQCKTELETRTVIYTNYFKNSDTQAQVSRSNRAIVKLMAPRASFIYYYYTSP